MTALDCYQDKGPNSSIRRFQSASSTVHKTISKGLQLQLRILSDVDRFMHDSLESIRFKANNCNAEQLRPVSATRSDTPTVLSQNVSLLKVIRISRFRAASFSVVSRTSWTIPSGPHKKTPQVLQEIARVVSTTCCNSWFQLGRPT